METGRIHENGTPCCDPYCENRACWSVPAKHCLCCDEERVCECECPHCDCRYGE